MTQISITYIDNKNGGELILNDYLIKSFKDIAWKQQFLLNDLTVDYLGELLNAESDGILLPADLFIYPLPEKVALVSFFGGGHATKGGFVLLTLKGKEDLFANFKDIDKRNAYGKVYIAGFGPGDPELLTLKTNRLLSEADVIFYDDLLDSTYLDRFPVEKHYVGKRKGKHSAKQETINEKLYATAIKGKKVVRLKGGDPLVFGRGGEEYHYLKQRFVDAEIIPGITSALAAAADGVIPLTSRGISTSVAFTLGHDAIYNKLPNADTLVFFMGAAQQKKWAARLIEQGWLANTPVAAVRKASLPNKQIKRYTLGELINAEETLEAPCLVIVGTTASHDLRAQGKKWLYTGSNINDFKEPGIVTHNPMISFKSLELTEELQSCLTNLKNYQRILFPSPIAVHKFFKALFSIGLDVRELLSLSISSMGVSTSAALKDYGLMVKPETEDGTTESLIAKLKADGVAGENILIPCSTQGLTVLPKQLQSMNNTVHSVAFYKSELPENAVRHNLQEFYGVVFTSPTSVRHFFKVYDYFPESLHVKSNGKITKQVLMQCLNKIGSNHSLVE